MINYIDRSDHFSRDELKCSFTSKCEMNPKLMELVERIRTIYGKPIKVSSAYRHPTHPIEANKDEPGMHAKGIAMDIVTAGEDAWQLMRIIGNEPAIKGLGVNQRGKWTGRFLHIDVRDEPAIWSY